MTKQAKQMWMELLPALLGGILFPLLSDLLKARAIAPAERGPNVKILAVIGLAAYAAFIALTVLFVKLAWRWIL